MSIIDSIDHLVLTVADIEESCTFYSKVLGMKVVTFGGGRKALEFGSQKINLHQCGQEFEPHAKVPMPGSSDLCFVASVPVRDVLRHLKHLDVEVLEGPVSRTGAKGPITSIYFRDPDGNLLEISNYDEPV
ncbi:biphenyl-2,3-diol 1,2-dioxygenase III-related protein [Marinobacter nitratireducens]|uniref:Biphenyl-2,3-diol 1,2-dioxygenase III-related protein n=1 Tax=Marinobacter nitratireducens TaxID=1137280 RepID=A0A072N5R7_9GAMM|nr:biphenyl-2,3-diol 1,2-dioxygenase III-related protein [Marinobacter nitratireducens]